MKFLCKDDRLPSEAIGKAFVAVAGRDDRAVVEFLQENSRLSTKASSEAFVAAGANKHWRLMGSLYDVSRIFPAAVYIAFMAAFEMEYAGIIVYPLLGYLCDTAYGASTF
ncbi:hypothetical protein PHYPSEUDO_013553 [Phytophthora pseudosyringae]|uniref:Uncharacterized protein n=1 Tax=Phytophthora pseudosyringae TaxID=221518 RepID=A0A8T1W1Y9_9STRA|nr:hypothetical protein PHYPSEUDO_013553 [Phytophthora pseudosyringae]